MPGITRGLFTLLGVAGAVTLLWLAGWIGDDSTGDYWSLFALVAAAGLTVALSQLLGGWTKWGRPRFSLSVFLLGFLPAFLVAAWVLAAAQPDENWFQRHITSWSDDLGIGGAVEDLLFLAGPLAFLAGLAFGLAFDTSGPRTTVAEPQPEPAAAVEDEARTEVRQAEPEPEARTEVRQAEPEPEARTEVRQAEPEPEAPTEVRQAEPEPEHEPEPVTRETTPR
jgi:outer membrane biosynthesis protein TonB